LSILVVQLFAPHNQGIMKLDSKYFDRIRTRRKREREPEVQAPTCQWDGCDKPGIHRAPVGRNAEGQFFLFCFEHVKEYNKGYNYFSGLSDSEIARYQKEAITGHRPTWTVGVNQTARDSPLHSTLRSGTASGNARIRDPFGFAGGFAGGSKAGGTRMQQDRKLKTLEAKAFDTLGLSSSAKQEDIKRRYKELVKKHHPDANGGDRGSEERFRAVVQAYQLLKQSGFC
jgi:curved DNA-binding protein CbpA